MTQEIKRTPSQLSIRLLSFTTHLCEFCYLRVGTSGPCSRQLMQWRLHIYLTYHHMDSLRILSRYCQQYSPQSARWSFSACLRCGERDRLASIDLAPCLGRGRVPNRTGWLPPTTCSAAPPPEPYQLFRSSSWPAFGKTGHAPPFQPHPPPSRRHHNPAHRCCVPEVSGSSTGKALVALQPRARDAHALPRGGG